MAQLCTTLGAVQIQIFDKYLKAIKNESKKEYAILYLNNHLRGLPEPSRGNLSYMAAQGVRMTIDEILKY